MVEKLVVKDFDDIIEITYDDILKYHGRQMLGGAALASSIMASKPEDLFVIL